MDDRSAPQMGREWYVTIRGQVIGPASLEHIADALAQGKMTLQDQVCAVGSQVWQPAEQVREIAALATGPRWFVRRGGAVLGPMDERAIQEDIESGSLDRRDLVCREGMGRWKEAESDPSLAALFNAPPPPPPAAAPSEVAVRRTAQRKNGLQLSRAGLFGALIAAAAVLLGVVAVLAAVVMTSEEPPRPRLQAESEKRAEAPPVPSPADPVEPKPEPEPSAHERAVAAIDSGDYDTACDYLEERGFSEVVCDWIVATIEADRDRPLYSDQYARFLRRQHVRRISGRIVGWYDAANNEYEVRVGGRTAILVMTESAFETTGGFRIWAQRWGSSPEVLNSGREVDVPIYREWPLHEQITEVARQRRDASGPATDLLHEIVRGWELDYCYEEDPLAGSACGIESDEEH